MRLKLIKNIFIVILALIASQVNATESSTWPINGIWGQDSYIFSGDFNGDGISDIVSLSGTNAYMKLGTGSGFSSETWQVVSIWGAGRRTFAEDFNGDGKTDIASISGDKAYMKLSTGSGFISETWSIHNQWGEEAYTFSGDFNGDGVPDVASFSGSNAYMKLGTKTGFTHEIWPVEGTYGAGEYTFPGDFNGDGVTDIVSISGATAYVKLSQYSKFKDHTWTISSEWGLSPFTTVGNFNGDKYTDIVTFISGNAYVKLNVNEKFVTEKKSVPNTWGVVPIFAGDFNGNKLSDIASVRGGDAYMKFIAEGPAPLPTPAPTLDPSLPIVAIPVFENGEANSDFCALSYGATSTFSNFYVGTFITQDVTLSCFDAVVANMKKTTYIPPSSSTPTSISITVDEIVDLRYYSSSSGGETGVFRNYVSYVAYENGGHNQDHCSIINESYDIQYGQDIFESWETKTDRLVCFNSNVARFTTVKYQNLLSDTPDNISCSFRVLDLTHKASGGGCGTRIFR